MTAKRKIQYSEPSEDDTEDIAQKFEQFASELKNNEHLSVCCTYFWQKVWVHDNFFVLTK